VTREVQSLRHVRILRSRPDCIPQGRPRGTKAAGVRYEEALAKSPAFAAASHGVWLEFDDAKGHGFAQVDFLFPTEDLPLAIPIVAEAKLTWTPAAYVQLRKLYFPLLQKLWGCQIGGIVVCQNLTRETPGADVVGSLAEAMQRVDYNPLRIPILHLPLLLKEPRYVARPKSGLPSWWRKGQTSPRVGHPGGRTHSA